MDKTPKPPPLFKHGATPPSAEPERTIFRFSGTPLSTAALALQMLPLSVAKDAQQDPAKAPVDPQTFKIRRASSDEGLLSARLLVEKMYQSRGYTISQPAPLDLDLPSHRTCLLIYGANDQPVGTGTIGLDNPDGLYADELYPQEMAELRQAGHRLAEITKLAVDRHSGNSKRLLATLMNVGVVHMHIQRCTYVVLEASLRHAQFYENSMGFERIGPERLCPRVNNPGVLLGQSLASMEARILRFAGQPAQDGQSQEYGFYRYFLNPQEQAELFERMASQEL